VSPKYFIAVLSLGLAASFGLAGCASDSRREAFVRTGDPVTDGTNAILHGPAKDRILWEYRTAAAAMRRQDFGQAKSLLDDALLTIGNIYGKDKSARQARGYFHEESKKTFLGEPYERVMAYYYRGILYWMDGEPDNARACFRSAQLQDSDTENKEYSADYVLLDYLDGYATAKLGGDGSDAFKRAEALSKIERPPPYNPKANVFIFIDFGQGPTKYATGQYGEELRFRDGSSPSRAAIVRVGNQNIRAGAYDDLTYQATTRGGRIMDHVLANKAVFKTGTDTFGNAALIGGIITAQNRGTEEIGLGLVAAGVIGKIVAAATTPAADIRSWNNLPQYLSFTALQLAPGEQKIAVDYVDAAGRPLLTKTLTVRVPESGRDTVIYVSDRNS
jgi:tetratricopeptide (TPR) repeat protein